MNKLFFVWLVTSSCCECSPIRNDTLSKGSDDCSDLKGCSFLLTQLESKDPGAITELADEAAYNFFCQELQTIKTCFNESKSRCDNDGAIEELEIKVAIVDNICTPEGKEATFALAQSECATNDVKRREAQERMDECEQTSESDINVNITNALTKEQSAVSFDFCPYMDSLIKCVTQGASDKCGKEFGSFIKYGLQTAAQPSSEQFGCQLKTRDASRFTKAISSILGAYNYLKRKEAIHVQGVVVNG